MLQPLTILKSFCSLQADDVAMPSLTLLKDNATSPLIMREVPLNATVDLTVRAPGEGWPRIMLKAPVLSPDVLKHIEISDALLEKAKHLKHSSRVSSVLSTLAIASCNHCSRHILLQIWPQQDARNKLLLQ